MIANEHDLNERLSRPSAATVDLLRQTSGDFLVIGAGGKMGPTLARLLRRAADLADTDQPAKQRRIIAVSRFRDADALRSLTAAKVETLQGDLFDRGFVDSLPECPNVIYMVGQKFGTSNDASPTWAVNAFLPGVICQRFPRSRFVTFSTGNVYPLVPIQSGGSVESDPLLPVGEYAMTAVARERIFSHFSQQLEIPMVILRLNYAVELRYGVLLDLAQKINLQQPISLAMGYLNCIWQGDANDMAVRSLAYAESPARVLNLTGPGTLSCREICCRLAERLGKQVDFVDQEAETALLNNAQQTHRLLGAPAVSLEQTLDWTADWVARGQPTWQRPTHFEVRDGQF